MISVYLGDYHYKFNGDYGILSNTVTGICLMLGARDTELCNRSNQNILSYINKNEYLFT